MNTTNPSARYIPPQLRETASNTLPPRPLNIRRRSAPPLHTEQTSLSRSPSYASQYFNAPPGTTGFPCRPNIGTPPQTLAPPPAHARRLSVGVSPRTLEPPPAHNRRLSVGAGHQVLAPVLAPRHTRRSSSGLSARTLAPPPAHIRRSSMGATPLLSGRSNLPPLPIVEDVAPLESPFEVLDFEDALDPIRSALGRNGGVHFVQLDTRCIVIKTARGIGPEWMAGLLAKAVGVRTPDMFIDREPDKALAALAGEAPKGVMLMSCIDGHSFAELTRADLNDLRKLTPRGVQLLEELGHVAAFDYFISNFDRFPVGVLGGVNRGNVMITAEGVVAIDNTLPNHSEAGSEGRRNVVQRRVRIVLEAINTTQDVPSEAEENLARFADFFDQDAALSWQGMRDPFLVGFRRGAHAVAEIDPIEVRRLAVQCGDVSEDLQYLLLEHLKLFKEAVQSADAPRLEVPKEHLGNKAL